MWSDNRNVVLYTQLHWIHSSIMQATNRKDGNFAIWQIHFGNFVNNILFLHTVLMIKKTELPMGSKWVYLTCRLPVKCQHLYCKVSLLLLIGLVIPVGSAFCKPESYWFLASSFPWGSRVLVLFLCLFTDFLPLWFKFGQMFMVRYLLCPLFTCTL